MRKLNTKCKLCEKPLYRIPSRLNKNAFCNVSHQLAFEYLNGIRDKKKIVEKAHEVIRKKGHYKRDNSYLSKPGHVSEEARKRLSVQRLGEGNPMFGKKPWNKLPLTKKWWEEKEFTELRKFALVRDNFICVLCGKGSIDLYCDHIIPYRICKEHKIENLQMLCGSCHSKKTAQDLKRFPELKNCRSTIVFLPDEK